jgi:hypothetical protein
MENTHWQSQSAAHDRRVEPVRDLSNAMAHCREALIPQLDSDGFVSDSRAAVVRLARHARAVGAPPEHFLAEFKEMLFHLPPFEARRAKERGEMMSALVGIAIEAYFARTDD